ncbi:hypothetical protein GCM10020220_035880 [Nonomuraea rubra]|uniref:hypothetical protein n=1 Tax=Nonomuraea rubra TaxID=46180 RepID=UPI0031E55A4C
MAASVALGGGGLQGGGVAGIALDELDQLTAAPGGGGAAVDGTVEGRDRMEMLVKRVP